VAKPTRSKMVFDDAEALQALCGGNNARLKLVERTAGVALHLRGNEVTIEGDAEPVELARTALEQLYRLALRGQALGSDDVVRAVKLVKDSGGATQIGQVFGETILTPRTGRPIAPKGVAQKQYVELVRGNDIAFAIGPAGTGKTYLAVAMAVRALLDKQVRRIILTRPAIEAGEKLGFLPGTLEEKIDPYLRPLLDALHDMLDVERVARHMADGIIEVAPLAFMRGRAQPVTTQVLTYEGWKAIGELKVGDTVTGSDGWPTKVLGVFPQGTKPVFRVAATDGASTLCCAEHLWAVKTASDKRRGKPWRVLQTQDLAPNLRVFHQHRYELPMLRAPVAFPASRVPLEPYSLGLLLGDGCITGKTTAQFSTGDAELEKRLRIGLGPQIQLTRIDDIDWRLSKHPSLPKNYVRDALEELGLLGTRSSTKFIPASYLWNCHEVRLALLQGLLDTDGGPVTQDGRTCRIQYTTTSPQLRDDVVFLVRSLGGVAYWRTRLADGRLPGFANGRVVENRSDSYVLDIRLPDYIKPFRLERKAKLYREIGGGRPMRFITSIEPAGEAECVCIQVDAPDSLYLTEDFLLTHNTLSGSFIILDEAQNTTPEQMKMLLTRMGFDSKLVVTGDPTQTDLPRGQRSGLRDALELLEGIRGIGMVRFSDVDVVRHPLVATIIRAYDARDRARSEARDAAAAGQPAPPAEPLPDRG
jgi:phosphate starvation-inducible protein PhoH and related proteins